MGPASVFGSLPLDEFMEGKARGEAAVSVTGLGAGEK
jgi:hypothetical protein